MTEAAKYGHITIVKSMIDKGVSKLDNALCAAAKGGYIEIVELILETGKHDLCLGICAASEAGHIKIVDLIISKEANDSCEGYRCLNRGGLFSTDCSYIDRVEWSTWQPKYYYTKAMCSAALGLHQGKVTYKWLN